MEEFKIFFLGVIQGITEFLPVSSSGHIVLFKYFFDISKNDIVMEVILHFGTLMSILIFFRKDIYYLLSGIINGNKSSQLYAIYLVVATIPVVIFSLIIKDHINSIFSVNILLYTYIVNSAILFMTKSTKINYEKVSLKLAMTMGIVQIFALFPGISRAGITICAGLLLGYRQKEVAKFSFFMAIPALLGAMVFELDNIIYQANSNLILILIGFLVSMVTGLLVLRLLFKILQNNKLWMFSYYCILIWIIIFFII